MTKAIQVAGKSLPSDLPAPSIAVRDPSESVVVVLSLTSAQLTSSQLSLIANGRIVPDFQQVPGVSNVTPGGNITPAYEVTVNPYKLAANNLTLTDVVNAVSTSNVRAPGGIAYEGNRETNIDIRGDIMSPESILSLPLAPPAAATAATGGGANGNGATTGTAGSIDPWTSQTAVLRVGDVAAVSASYEPRRQYASVNGLTGLFLQIQKTSSSSEVDASNNVIAALPRIKAEFPEINFNVINVQSRFSEQQLDGVMRTLLEGIALTGIVMLFFLGSWRNAIVVLIAIPASLGVAIFVMKMLGLTLDTISLLGMTLVVGILVDDSTVVLENIERHHEMGEYPMHAAITGRTEIGVAAIVITLVDVVVFLPIAFIQSQIGRQLAEFGIVVVISTLTSLFVCFTVTPSLAANWALRGTWKPWWVIRKFIEGFHGVRSWYAGRALPWGLHHRTIVLGFCLISFIGAMALVPLGIVGEEFVPPQDRGELFIQIQYPIGTPLKHTIESVLGIERKLRSTPDLGADTAVAGAYAAPFGGFVTQGNVGQIHIWLRDGHTQTTEYWVREYGRAARQLAPNAQVVVVPVTGTSGGNVAQPIDELVTDDSGGDPTAYADQIYKTMIATPGARNVISSAFAKEPQVDLMFDRAKARDFDLEALTCVLRELAQRILVLIDEPEILGDLGLPAQQPLRELVAQALVRLG